MPNTPGTLVFPTTLDDVISLFEVTNRATTTISTSANSGDTTIIVASTALFPSTGAISIENEVIYYTGKTSTTFTGCLRASNGTSAAAHSSGVAVDGFIIAPHHSILSSAIIALETKVGYGASNQTPTTVGHVLKVTAAGQTAWGAPGAGAWGTITGTLSSQTDLQAALDAKANVGSTGLGNPTATIGLTAVNGSAGTGLRSDGAPALSQAIVPTWTGIHTFIQSPAADPAQSNSAVVNIFRGADSSSGTPLNSDLPSTYFQTIRTGGTHSGARFGFLWNYQVSGASAADNYVNYTIARLTPSMSGAPSGDYFHEINRNYLILSATNISGQNIHGYTNTAVAERTVSGVRVVGTYTELRNNTSADANVSTGSIDSTFNLVTSQGTGFHNTGLWYAEGPSNATSGYFGAFFAANSVVQRIFDLSIATQTLQGTWTATNGSTSVTGSGGHADVEVVAGDWLLINGTYARAGSATANAITLSSNFTGTTGSSLTITKSAQAMWLRENQPIAALNHAGTARKEILRYGEDDHIYLDNDAVGTICKSYISFGTNTAAAPSDTLTSGWRIVGYDGGSGARYGDGVESGYRWTLGNGQKFYVSGSNSPVIALTLESTAAATFASSVNAQYFAPAKGIVNVSNGLNSNINIGTVGFVRQGGATGAFSLGGFTGGVDGRVLYWFNNTAQTMTIVNEDASSTAANRVATLTGGNVVLRATAQSFAMFIYSGSDSRWILVSTN